MASSLPDLQLTVIFFNVEHYHPLTSTNLVTDRESKL